MGRGWVFMGNEVSVGGTHLRAFLSLQVYIFMGNGFVVGWTGHYDGGVG